MLRTVTQGPSWRSRISLDSQFLISSFLIVPKFTLIGSGLAGGLLAAFLGRRGTRSISTNAGPTHARATLVGGRSINLALSTRGIHALQQLGIADEVLRHAIPMRGRMIHDKSGDLHFSPYDRDPNKCINSIGRGALNTAVIEAAQRYPNVRVHFNHRCTDVDLERRGSTARHETNHRRALGRRDHRGRRRFLRRAPFDAAARSLRIQPELSRPRLQGADHPAGGRRRLADGKKRAPHLAAQEFHDDRAAESRRLVHLHALLGIRRAAQLRDHEDRRRRPPLLRGRIPRCRPAHAGVARRISRESDRLTRDDPLRAVVLSETRSRSSATPPMRWSRSTARG